MSTPTVVESNDAQVPVDGAPSRLTKLLVAELTGVPNEAFDLASLTPKQLRSVLKISEPVVYSLLRSGALPSFKVGGSRRVLVSDLAAYIARAKAGDDTWAI
jgi:excisionase family DNA binding protein